LRHKQQRDQDKVTQRIAPQLKARQFGHGRDEQG
jgi:hypothetical protein